jgi:hypothetical protein
MFIFNECQGDSTNLAILRYDGAQCLQEGDNEEGDGRRRIVRKASEGSWKHGQGRLKVNGK